MLREKRRKTNIGVGLGIVLQIIGLILLERSAGTQLVGALLILLSLWSFTWGCMNYAEGKGHSRLVGLVGLAGIVGLIILVILPDRRK